MGIAAIAGAISDPSQLAAMFGMQPILIGPAGQELVIDLITEESPEYTNEITNDPVECGTDITDHIFKKPSTLTLDCIFTDMQFSLAAIISGLLNGNLSLATWRDKKSALYKMFNAGELVNVSTPLHFYSNYLIESVSPTMTAQTGDCFRCRIVLQQVNLVASAIGWIDPLLLPPDLQEAQKASKAQGKTNEGPAETEPETAPKTKGSNSTADAYAF